MASRNVGHFCFKTKGHNFDVNQSQTEMKYLLIFVLFLTLSCTSKKNTLTLEDKLDLIQSKSSVANVISLYQDQLYEVDCTQIDQMLYDIHEADQELRTSGEGSEDTDYNNLIAVLSILESCGFPTLQDLSNINSRLAIPLVLQHQSNQDISSYYLDEIIKSEKEGAIPKGFVPLMIDRQLMHNGFKQVYGTQIKYGQLYELEDPENVNQRREEAGLHNTIEDYLDRFGLTLEDALSNQFLAEESKQPI